MNLNGSLPSIIANKVLENQPKELLSVKRYLEELSN